MTPQEKIKNNEFLLSLDMSDASRDQKIAWLSQIIENEIQKPLEQQDLDLIAECTEYMMELSESDIMIPLEKKRQALLETKANNPAVEKKGRVITKKPKLRLKIVAAIAALLVLSFSTLTVAAKVGGHGNAWDFVVANIERLFNMEQGDSFEEGSITLIKGGESVSYQSMEEMISKENVDVLYPTKLPKDIQITVVKQLIFDEDNITYIIVFDNDALSILATTDWAVSADDLTSYEIYSTHDRTFYIKAFSNGTYQAIGYDEKYEYNITYSNYDELKNILDNMKGIEQ